MRLGELFGLAREIKGMTTRELAVLAGVSNPLITQIELGQVRNPGFYTVVKLADALGLSIDRVVKSAREDLLKEKTDGQVGTD